MTTEKFIRYLASKKTVDDRALNRRVWDAMVDAAAGRQPRVLEVGGGIGTMVERVVEDGRLLPRSWTLLDAQATLVAEAQRRLAGRVPFPVEHCTADLEAFIDGAPPGFDLVVANAVVDLFDPARILGRMRALGRPGALFLFSITFDGLTAIEPAMDPDLDRRVISLYHATMDGRVVDGQPSGDSRAGRHLLTLLPAQGYRLLEAGASDWVVYPRGGAYPADEEFFLSCILDFFEESLAGHRGLEPGELERWLTRRREQVAARELVLVAHQLDVLARALSPYP
jgi:hypothetical protein